MMSPTAENARPTRNAAGRASSASGEAARPKTSTMPRMVEPVSQALLAAQMISPATMSSITSGA
jgi:hypothetical protein